MYPEISASLSVILPELDAKAKPKKRFSFLYISLYAIYCNTILFIFILLAR